jgi:hypothetical protein
MVLGYAVDVNVILATIAMVLAVFWIVRLGSRGQDPCIDDSVLVSKIDFEPGLMYVGVALLTEAFTDTGVCVQQLYDDDVREYNTCVTAQQGTASAFCVLPWPAIRDGRRGVARCCLRHDGGDSAIHISLLLATGVLALLHGSVYSLHGPAADREMDPLLALTRVCSFFFNSLVRSLSDGDIPLLSRVLRTPRLIMLQSIRNFSLPVPGHT